MSGIPAHADRKNVRGDWVLTLQDAANRAKLFGPETATGPVLPTPTPPELNQRGTATVEMRPPCSAHFGSGKPRTQGVCLMDYRIDAIPTLYRGQRYRSRLEARWAAFFDVADWRHEYEPFLADGWLPDFRLQRRVLVEIKPTEQHDPRAKMERAVFGCEVPLLLLNHPIAETGEPVSEKSAGSIGEARFPGGEWRDAYVGRNGTKLDIFTERTSRWLLTGEERPRLPNLVQAILLRDWWDKAERHLIDADAPAWERRA